MEKQIFDYSSLRLEQIENDIVEQETYDNNDLIFNDTIEYLNNRDNNLYAQCRLRLRNLIRQDINKG